MAELVVLMLSSVAKTGEVREAWQKAGVSGSALFSSRRLAPQASPPSLPDDLPLFPSLQHLLRSQAEPCETLFAVVPDGFDVEALTTATEAVTGSLDKPGRGILLAVPIRQAWGLCPKEAYGTLPAS